MATATVPAVEREDYLNKEYGISSWLLTTDHKRIALLYLISITFFFFIGGFFALLIRLELLTPAGDLVQADTYNKLFTMHGQVMVFFFLIPSIPAVLGNYLIPLMVGAKDLAFPRINLLSWYIYIIAGILMMHCMLTGGVDTGWTFYTPFSTAFSNTKVIEAGLAIFISGFSSILTGSARPSSPSRSFLLSPNVPCTWESSTRNSAVIPCSSSTCSGSTPILLFTS